MNRFFKAACEASLIIVAAHIILAIGIGFETYIVVITDVVFIKGHGALSGALFLWAWAAKYTSPRRRNTDPWPR